MRFAQNAAAFAARHWPISLLTALLAIFIVVPGWLERLFVYYPTRDVTADPSAVGLGFRDIFLQAEDGPRLHGWFVPHGDAAITLLLLHGNAGNIGHRVMWINELHGLGVHILIIDYRGYGRSEGSPSEKGLYRDALAAYSWWLREQKGPENLLVVIGESLGGAVAVDLASRAPMAGMILQSTFTSARDMAKTILPIGLLQPLTGVRFDSVGKVGGIRCPKLFIHGDQDDIVPFRLGRKLFDAAAPPKEFWEVPAAGHNDLVPAAGSAYRARIGAFLNRIKASPKAAKD